MGNALEGQTYVKGTHKSIQPRIASNVDTYKSHQKISSSSNIHSQNIHSMASFTRPMKSETTMTRKTIKKLTDDIQQINDENYDEHKYVVKKLPFRNSVNISMI